MQAIILAAGMGRRLGEYTKDNTKCMVEVNGIKLIDRMLMQLSSLHLNKVIIVVGYKGTHLIQHIGNRYEGLLNIEYVNNPVYDKTNNIFSLALAKEYLENDDTLLLESDLILDDHLFHLITSSQMPNIALVAKYESWMDGTMVRLDDDNNIVSFIPKSAFKYSEKDTYYKTVNIYKFSKEFSRDKYIPFLDAYCKAVGNNEYYENVLSIISYLNSHVLKALPIGNEKWYEIDDKQDLDIAEALFAEEKDLLKKYYGRYGGYWRFPKMLDYCYLVNPYFPSPRLMEELKSDFDTLLTQYPSGMKVNTLLASKCFGVSEDYIVPGNGAAELIKALLEMVSGKLGCVRPTFEEYPNRYTSDLEICYVPHNDEYRYGTSDLISFFSQHPVETLVLINPDNPSGNFIPINDVLKLADWCELNGTRLVVDESFVDFSDDYRNNSLLHDDLLESHPHLVVMKSISKSFGIPGIRLGILASADTSIISNIKKNVSIWNLNSFAEYFMQIFNKYEKDYNKACGRFVEERQFLYEALNGISFMRVMPSQANYFLCEILPPLTANKVVLSLLKRHNILTRDCSDKKGLDGKQYMRIAIRSHEDNIKLTEALRELDQTIKP